MPWNWRPATEPVFCCLRGGENLYRRKRRKNLTDEQRLLVLGRMYERQKKAHGGDRKSSAQNEHMKTAEKIVSLAGVGQATVRRAAEFAKAVDAIRDMGVLYQLTALLSVKTVRGISPAPRLPSPPWGPVHNAVHTSQACRNGLNQGDNSRGSRICLCE